MYFRIILLPDPKIYDEIAELRDTISNKHDIPIDSKYKKVPPHISLLFLSQNIGPQDAVDITKRLKKPCMRLKPFKVRIEGFGYFTKTKSFPIYLAYLKVVKDKNLTRLYGLVDAHTMHYAKVKFAEFIPHISLIGIGQSRAKFLKVRNECQKIKFKRSFLAKAIYVGIQKNENDGCKLTRLGFNS